MPLGSLCVCVFLVMDLHGRFGVWGLGFAVKGLRFEYQISRALTGAYRNHTYIYIYMYIVGIQGSQGLGGVSGFPSNLTFRLRFRGSNPETF